jgi:hypothetical protein
MTLFDFGKFEMKLFRKPSDKNNIQYHFNLAIDKNIKNDKIGTAESFKYTLKSFVKFSKEIKKCSIEKLTFETITVDWLNDYEKFMLSKNRGYTSIGIYTRTLRIIFNNAIGMNDIREEVYPFSKAKNDGLYKIPRTKKVIATYGTKNKSSFIFDIIDAKDDSSTQYKKIRNFTRYINDHIKRIAKANDLPKEIYSYWARHSFATAAIRKGASMEFISEALNHSDLSVTKHYFAGFEDEAKREFANNLIDF